MPKLTPRQVEILKTSKLVLQQSITVFTALYGGETNIPALKSKINSQIKEGCKGFSLKQEEVAASLVQQKVECTLALSPLFIKAGSSAIQNRIDLYDRQLTAIDEQLDLAGEGTKELISTL